MATTRERTEYGPITRRLTARRVVGLWGIAVTAGWIVTQLAVLTGSESQATQGGLTTFWLIGSLVPIVASGLWMRKDGLTGLFPVWTVLGVTGLLVSFATVGGGLGVDPTLVYGALWFAGPAVGFVVTAWYVTDWSGRLYAVAGLLNLVAAVAVVVVPAFTAVYGLVAAVVQGGPMVYHAVRMG